MKTFHILCFLCVFITFASFSQTKLRKGNFIVEVPVFLNNYELNVQYKKQLFINALEIAKTNNDLDFLEKWSDFLDKWVQSSEKDTNDRCGSIPYLGREISGKPFEYTNHIKMNPISKSDSLYTNYLNFHLIKNTIYFKPVFKISIVKGKLISKIIALKLCSGQSLDWRGIEKTLFVLNTNRIPTPIKDLIDKKEFHVVSNEPGMKDGRKPCKTFCYEKKIQANEFHFVLKNMRPITLTDEESSYLLIKILDYFKSNL